MKVSISTPTPITKATRNEPSGTIANSAKEAASASPATVTARAAFGAATAIASQAHAPRLVPDAPGDEDVVVRAESDEQHRGRERDVVGEVVVAQDLLEEERGESELASRPRMLEATR